MWPWVTHSSLFVLLFSVLQPLIEHSAYISFFRVYSLNSLGLLFPSDFFPFCKIIILFIKLHTFYHSYFQLDFALAYTFGVKWCHSNQKVFVFIIIYLALLLLDLCLNPFYVSFLLLLGPVDCLDFYVLLIYHLLWNFIFI